jgi:hypothetical protein
MYSISCEQLTSGGPPALDWKKRVTAIGKQGNSASPKKKVFCKMFHRETHNKLSCGKK